METKKKTNYFKIIFYILIFSFLIVYIINKSGYINTVNYNKTLYTEEEINDFENDVKNNKEIKDKYLNLENKNYANKFSDMGEKISTYINEGGEYIIKILSDFFEKLFG